MRMGGAEKLVSEIVPLLRRKGYDIDVCLFDGVETAFKRELTAAGVAIYTLGVNSNVYNPIFIVKLAKLMRHYDIVHTHNTAPQLFAAIASLICSAILVTTEHTTSNRRRNWKCYAWVDKWMYSRYKRIICISDSTETNLRRFINEKTDKIYTIYNGINVGKFATALPFEKSMLTSNLHGIVVAMVSGFRHEKDQETVIRAMKHLAVDAELWLIGDGERRPIIEQCIKDNNLLDRVRLLGIRSDIPSLLKAADIVVQSSHWEGFGLAAVEGMAAGKPVIASDVEGLAQVVEGAGLLFPPGDDEALASIIQRLSEDKELYKQVADKCYKRAQMYDIQKMVDSYSELYRSLMNL